MDSYMFPVCRLKVCFARDSVISVGKYVNYYVAAEIQKHFMSV